MGEVFLSFQQITRSDCAVDMNDLEQIILPLTKPPEIGIRFTLLQLFMEKWLKFILSIILAESEYFNLLESRTWDKTARDFVRKENKKRTTIGIKVWGDLLCYTNYPQAAGKKKEFFL